MTERSTLSRYANWNIDAECRVSLNGDSLGLADTAWFIYALVHAGRADEAEPLLTAMQRQRLPAAEAMDAAYWLWAYGTFRSAVVEASAAAEGDVSAAVAEAVSLLERDWQKPAAHWLGGEEPAAVWFASLAIVFGGLLAVQPHAPLERERIQRLLKSIREFVFAKFIKAEKVVSRLGTAEIHGDIVLAAVPFGMLGIEDRILIEALSEVERELAYGNGVRYSDADTYYGGCERPELTCLLAWYYSEKGDLPRAKQLLAHVEQLLEREQGLLYVVDRATAREPLYAAYWQDRIGEPPVSPLAMLLHAIAERNVAAKQGDSQAAEQRVQFLHEPIGTGDPYVQFAYERLPREPLAGDVVLIRMVTQPFRREQDVRLHVRVNGADATSFQMIADKGADGESYWETALGRFTFGDQVEYWFSADQDEAVSSTYAFLVRDWMPLGSITGWLKDERSVKVVFHTWPGTTSTPSIVFEQALNGEALNIRFEVSDKPQQALTHFGSETADIELGALNVQLFRSEESGLQFAVSHEGRTLLQSYDKHGHAAAEVLTDGTGRVCKIRYNFLLASGERLYGMGERFARFEYRGLTVDNYVYNEYRSQGMRTYLPVPFVINSGGFGLFANTPMYAVFDFGDALADRMQLQVDMHVSKPELELYVLPGQPMEATRKFTDLTGKPALPPKWAFGPWMSSNNWDSQAVTLNQVELTNEHEIPATVLVLEQWSDEATFYIFNDAQYAVKDGNDVLRYEDFTFPEWGRWPDPKRMVESLHENGLKVLLWQIPIHKHMYGIAHGQLDADETAMLANGFEVHTVNGAPYRIPYNWFKDSLVIDFTNEAARRWWFDKRAYLLTDLGVDGFKTDGGECIFGLDLRFADGRTGAEMRNAYPNEYIGSYYRFVQEHVQGGGITFSRAGYTGAQQFPLHWAGDERSTFEAFKSSIRAGLSSGLSGIPFWGWDLGGFHGDIPTPELFIRSTQMAAFCPVMQYHAESKGEFNQDRTPWNIAERTGRPDVLALYKTYADMRMNLLPYIYVQALTSSRLGVPLMRAMFAAFPDDPSCATLFGQYMFGDSLLVAPVIDEGHFTKNVYFPVGHWMPLFGGTVAQEGGRYVTVQADLGHIPAYIRENSAVPLNLNASLQLAGHVGNWVDRYEQLCFCLYVTESMHHAFEDDLGSDVSISAQYDGSRMELLVRSNRPEAVTIWLRGAGFVQGAVSQQQPLRRVNSADDLVEGTFLLRGGDCFIRMGTQVESATLL